jgi:hypothetical protein
MLRARSGLAETDRVGTTVGKWASGETLGDFAARLVSLMADDTLEEQDERLKERLITSEFALLNTLASIAALFIGAASVIAALSAKVPRGFFLAIILLCTTVLLNVLLDFRAYRRIFEGMAFTPKGVRRDPVAGQAYSEKLDRLKLRTISARRWKQRREKLSYVCLLTVVVLFIVVVYHY